MSAIPPLVPPPIPLYGTAVIMPPIPPPLPPPHLHAKASCVPPTYELFPPPAPPIPPPPILQIESDCCPIIQLYSTGRSYLNQAYGYTGQLVGNRPLYIRLYDKYGSNDISFYDVEDMNNLFYMLYYRYIKQGHLQMIIPAIWYNHGWNVGPIDNVFSDNFNSSWLWNNQSDYCPDKLSGWNEYLDGGWITNDNTSVYCIHDPPDDTNGDCFGNPCGPNGNCTDGINEYKCECHLGYGFDGVTCININECVRNPCGSNGKCTDDINEYQCDCDLGYEFDDVTCINIDECFRNPCGPNGNCADGINEYQCDCDLGFEFDDGICINIDDCFVNPCGTNGNCTDEVDGYNCNCDVGYEFLDGTCVDINDCEGNPCGPNGICIDSISDYTCLCGTGYKFVGGTCGNEITELKTVTTVAISTTIPYSSALTDTTTAEYDEARLNILDTFIVSFETIATNNGMTLVDITVSFTNSASGNKRQSSSASCKITAIYSQQVVDTTDFGKVSIMVNNAVIAEVTTQMDNLESLPYVDNNVPAIIVTTFETVTVTSPESIVYGN